MKCSSSIRLVGAALLAAGLCAAAQAQTVAQPAVSKADPRAAEIADGDTRLQADTNRFCPRDTGTRIVARNADKSRCTAPGRVYTSDDLQGTGEVDLGDALRKLDPAIR